MTEGGVRGSGVRGPGGLGRSAKETLRRGAGCGGVDRSGNDLVVRGLGVGFGGLVSGVFGRRIGSFGA